MAGHRPGTSQGYLDHIIAYLGTMGAVVSPEKCQFGTEVTFVGFKVRGTNHGMEISMAEVKRARLEAELRIMEALVSFDTGGELEPAIGKLAGRLHWYWPALSNSYAWMEPFHCWRRHATRFKTMSPEDRAHVIKRLQEAVGWWLTRVVRSAGQWTAIGSTRYCELAVVDASGPDVSGEFSIGGILWRRAGSIWEEVRRWQGLERSGARSTQEAELAAILEAWAWMDTAAGLVVSDSTAAVSAAARGYTRSYGDPVNLELREAMERPGQLRRVIWTPREQNTAADALSRPQDL